MVQHVRVLDLNKVQPAASSASAGTNTPLTANFLEMVAGRAKVLCREGARAHSRCVRLYCANDLTKLAGVEPKANNNATQTYMGSQSLVGSCSMPTELLVGDY